MPELPEVETVKNCLKEMILGKRIVKVEVLREKNVERNTISYFVSSLEGATITNFSRVGKYIIFHFDNGKVLMSHLRMEGKYFVRNEGEKYSMHDIAIFHFSDKTYLAYNDTRKFGTLQVGEEATFMSEEPMTKVGPDPFMMKDASLLVNAFKNVKVAIKTCLLDQSVMSGLGNIYVDEVLFACKIHPETPANLIKSSQFDEILKYSQEIMGNAIGEGGTTIKSYHPREGVNGKFQFSLKVYGQNGGKCVNCGTPLKKIFVGGRGTTFCPHCQKNIGLPYVLGITGPIGSGKSTALKYFEENGYVTISADKIVHDLYLNKKIQEGIKAFIPELKIVDGEIDRPSLKEVILKDPKKKQLLQKYIHELTRRTILLKIKKCKPGDKVAVEVPLLYESKFNEFCDATLQISLSKDSQIRNLNKRGDNVEKSLKLNTNYVENKKATYTIYNDGDVAKFIEQLSYLR